jgi:hypothetical protein
MKAPELYIRELELLQFALRERAERLKKIRQDIPGVRRKLKIKMVFRTPLWKWGNRIKEIEEGADEARSSVNDAINECFKLHKKLDDSTTIERDEDGNSKILTFSELREKQAAQTMSNIFAAIKNLAEGMNQ